MKKNELYPIFLKTELLDCLVVGGGHVALEKLSFLLKSSPKSQVTMVSKIFRPEIKTLAQQYNLFLIEDAYHKKYIEGRHIVIVATNQEDVNIQVHRDCRDSHILVNVADNPSYCDFYLGGIVTKGNLKIAISTNGKSPTVAKRLRQFFEDVIPEEINILIKNMEDYRKTLKGSFQKKLEKLNQITEKFIDEK